MSDDEETAVLRRGIRGDLIIAVCALVISMAATAASWWQSRVVAQQLSAQVWPYLSIETTRDPQAISVDIVNDGLGPALIRSTVLSIDEKPFADPVAALRELVPKRSHQRLGVDLYDLGPGSVIRASGSVRIVRLEGAWIVPIFVRNLKRIDVSVCYCSLLGNCWQTSTNQEGDPTQLARCPAVGKAQYKVPATF